MGHTQAGPQEDSKSIDRLYDFISGDEDARVCKDIPESACHHIPRNFFSYLIANFLSKVADELASARLILPWLLGAVGAPAAFIGFLVPIREAGVLIPQLVVAAFIRHLQKRKGVWMLGGLLSAISLAIMAVSIQLFEGSTAGWAIIIFLIVFSLARGICSVSAKDVLGKTVSKTRRGALMGYSAAAAGAATLVIGIGVERYAGQSQSISLFIGFLLAAAAIWLAAIIVFSLIIEEPGATEGGGNALTAAIKSLSLLRTDTEFRQYVIARILLLSVALSPPFYVLLAQQRSGELTSFGLLIIASGLAGSLSAPVWGRMGDRSSKTVMIIASAAAFSMGMITWLLDLADFSLLENPWFLALLFLLNALFHSGVRLGRKIYLVDMASQDNRSAYVAISNTVIGVAMMAGGLIGVLADLFPTSFVIMVLGVISLLAAVYITRMPEVSG